MPSGKPALDLYGAVPLTIGTSAPAPAPAEGSLAFPCSTTPSPPAADPPAAAAAAEWGRLQTALAAGASAAAVTPGVLCALAASAAGTYHSADTDYTELEDLRARTNTLAYGALGAGGLAAGLGGAAVVTWRF